MRMLTDLYGDLLGVLLPLAAREPALGDEAAHHHLPAQRHLKYFHDVEIFSLEQRHIIIEVILEDK